MKKLILILICFQSLSTYAQNNENIYSLDGYFIVSCFDTTLNNGCDLNIATTESITGDNMTCGDGNFYKNISTIMYVNTKDLDLKQIDDFEYRVGLQKNEHHAYLSTNPLILLEASNGDSIILSQSKLVSKINENQKTADLIQRKIDKLHLDFKDRRHYYILMKISIKVINLPKRTKPKTYTDPCGLDQYLILYDKKNKIKVEKVISPF